MADVFAPTRSFSELSHEEQAAERAKVEQELVTEQGWHEQYEGGPYKNKASLLLAIAQCELVPVPEYRAQAYRQYLQNRARYDELQELAESECSVGYLRPRALEVLHHVASMARRRLIGDRAFREDIMKQGLYTVRFAVTSMTRTTQYQAGLADQLAVRDGHSTHEFGMAFDLDHSGYYGLRDDGSVIGINGNANSHMFDPRIPHVLEETLAEQADEGRLHVIKELPNDRGCFHVAVSPE